MFYAIFSHVRCMKVITEIIQEGALPDANWLNDLQLLVFNGHCNYMA